MDVKAYACCKSGVPFSSGFLLPYNSVALGDALFSLLSYLALLPSSMRSDLFANPGLPLVLLSAFHRLGLPMILQIIVRRREESMIPVVVMKSLRQKDIITFM